MTPSIIEKSSPLTPLPRLEPSAVQAEFLSAVQRVKDHLKKHPDEPVAVDEVSHLLAELRQVTRLRVFQLLQENRDVMLLLMGEVQAYPGGRMARILILAREVLNMTDGWLANADLEGPSQRILRRVEELGL